MDTEIRVSKNKLTLEKKILQPFSHESGVLTTELSPLPMFAVPVPCLPILQSHWSYMRVRLSSNHSYHFFLHSLSMHQALGVLELWHGCQRVFHLLQPDQTLTLYQHYLKFVSIFLVLFPFMLSINCTSKMTTAHIKKKLKKKSKQQNTFCTKTLYS